jgi:putative (di)nucleoside polyphosphate hydrolase
LNAWDRRAAAVVPSNRGELGEVFRAGIGLVVLDQRGLVLALERSDVPGAWQLPQGGIKTGEDIGAAAWRELEEETGLGPSQVVLERTSDVWTGYELPQGFRSEKTGRGQVHKWLVFRLQPEVDMPSIPGGKEAEFRDSRWVTFQELLDNAVDFRRAPYEWLASWITRVDHRSQ